MSVNHGVPALATAWVLFFRALLAAEDSAWVPIFNGKDLKNWVPKFEGKPLGENPDGSFAVKDGMLFANNHLAYGTCGFGHLFYTGRKFSHYIIRAEYRFTQEKSAPGFATWTNQNNGLMLHSQDPGSLTLAGTFPSSIEVQLLGPLNTNESGVIPSAEWPVGKTANLCTPQSFVSWKGADHTQHCTPAYRSYFVKNDSEACRVSGAVGIGEAGGTFRFHARPGLLVVEGAFRGAFRLQALALDGRLLAEGPGVEALELPASAPRIFLARAVGSFGARGALVVRP